MSRKNILLSNELSTPIGHYTDAVRCGDFLFMSGAAPFDASMQLVGRGDIAKQTRKTLENIQAMLSAADMAFSDVVHWRILLERASDQMEVDRVLKDVQGSARSAVTYIVVQSFAMPGMLLEIEGVAYSPGVGASPREEVMVDGVADLGLHYCHVCKAGDFAWLSGVNATPIDANGHLFAVGDPALQAEMSYQNMEKMCHAVGMATSDIAKLTIFIDKIEDNQMLRPAREKFHGANRPTSALIGVKGLILPNQHHLFEAIAYKPSEGAPARQEISLSNFLTPISHYTDAVRCGDLLFISGVCGVTPDMKPVHEADVVLQAERLFEIMQQITSACGAALEDIVKITVFHKYVLERTMIEPARKTVFKNNIPASTLFGIKALAEDTLRLEVEAIAYVPRLGL